MIANIIVYKIRFGKLIYIHSFCFLIDIYTIHFDLKMILILVIIVYEILVV